MTISTVHATQVMTICSMVLYLKFFIALAIQANKSVKADARPPEDKSTKSNEPKPTLEMGDEPSNEAEYASTPADMTVANAAYVRWQRIVANDLENIPLALILAWGALIASGNNTVNVVAIIVFTTARVMHTMAYAFALQPYRSICWLIGVLAILVLAGNAIYGSFKQ